MPPRCDPEQQIAELASAMQGVAAALMAQANANTTRDQEMRQQNLHNARSKGLTDFEKHDPPKFKGKVDPEKADEWIQELEKIFEVMECAARTNVTFTAYLLIGDVEYWWKSTKSMMEVAQEEVTWETFKRKFLHKYFQEAAYLLFSLIIKY